ncbi:MAG: phosphonoacetaldehyde reductase [Oscillospiraceae bacterium]|nr:phosphonoacetaldehyde reductase [Oscillospiraceae bacterium]
MQQTFTDFSALEILKDKRPLLVCDGAFDSFGIDFPGEVTRFSDFSPNPIYEDIKAGVKILRKYKCDYIVAVGGGSSIDTAKGIKYYNHTDIPVMAVPTTAGTGSEATHFAALYKNGEKYSVADDRLLPDCVILQPELLKSLPVYQKKCTMLDALCQAIESWWSKKAVSESKAYSQKAVRLIIDNMDDYLKNEAGSNKNMLTASNLAGKAINITTTTAPHAMCYKLTTMYGLPHGHAAALCLPKVWRYMGGFDDIAKALGKKKSGEAISFFEQMLRRLEILPPRNISDDDLEILTNSVNIQRLKNNPVRLDKDTIRELYRRIPEVQ